MNDKSISSVPTGTALDRKELVSTLGNSLYAGAKPESIMLAISYCAAAGLDIMQKPVHIVPMSVKDAASGNQVFRDVIMPGIGLYRIQADRSETMAGISAPEFGPDVTQDFNDKNGNAVTCTFPEWCKIEVSKIIHGSAGADDRIVKFVALEYWLENYATDSGKSTAPNSMWRKRPRAQLVKCAESQALRRGWPEVGQSPTAEEMEGKTIGEAVYEVVDEPAADTVEHYAQDLFEVNLDSFTDKIKNKVKSADELIDFVASKGKPFTKEQQETLRAIEVPGK